MSASVGRSSTGGLPGPDHVLALVLKRAVVAVGHAGRVEAKHLAPAGHHVDAVAFHGRRRAHAQIEMVEQRPGDRDLATRNDQLPDQLAGGFVQTLQQPAAGRLAAIVAQREIVRADIDAAAGDGRVPIGLRAQQRRPLDVLGRFRQDAFAGRILTAGHEEVGQALFAGNHVPLIASTPLRIVAALQTGRPSGQTQHDGPREQAIAG